MKCQEPTYALTDEPKLDPDVRSLSKISRSLSEDYKGNNISWQGSPFFWIKSQPSRTRGKIGEALVEGFFREKGFKVAKSPGTESDRIIGCLKAEIKFSTLWRGGFYKFQQLREQDYDIVICLGVSPFDAHCWTIPKLVIWENLGKCEGLSSQHAGSKGRDTGWLQVHPGNIQGWLTIYGGTLKEGVTFFKKYLKG